jgi:hypothetical protein
VWSEGVVVGVEGVEGELRKEVEARVREWAKYW